jgi:hypothetical protein
LLAPFLPEKRVRQLLSVLNTLPEIDLSDLSHQIGCYLPQQQRYCEELDLSLSIALLSSYLQQPVPANTLMVGELDLMTRVRAPREGFLANLAALLLGPYSGKIRRLFVAKEAASRLSKTQAERDGPRLGDNIEIRGVTDLQDVLADLWPSLVGIRDPRKEAHGTSGQRHCETELA